MRNEPSNTHIPYARGKLGRNTGNWQTASRVGCEGAAGNADQIQHSWMLRTDTLSLSLASGGARISVSPSHYSHLLPCDWEACGAHHHIQYSGTLCGLSMWLQPMLRIGHPYLSGIWQGLQLRADTETTRVTMR
jgi:hypothetical protein